MVKIGIIGLGKWGINHLRSLAEIDCDFIGISDVDVKKTDLAEKYGVAFFEDYHDLLKVVDAVTVATPTDAHYQIVSDCIYAGRHVLVEKPIASTSEQSEKLVELAKSKNIILSVGYLYRFNNSIRRVKELIKEIGEIQYITCRYIHSTKPPRKDSGVIMNLGSHVVDILNFILDNKPVTVNAKKKNLLSPHFEDSASILLDYKDFFATADLSCTHPEKARDIWIIAEKEKIYVDYLNQKILRYPLKVTYENVEREPPYEEYVTPNEPLKEELKHFCEVVGSKSKAATKEAINIGAEDYYTTRICELALKSAEEGKEFEIE